MYDSDWFQLFGTVHNNCTTFPPPLFLACFPELLLGSGNLSSTNFPSDYLRGERCFHILTAADETEQVAISFSYFDTEQYYDSVAFYDVEYPSENAFFGDFMFDIHGNYGNITTAFSPFKSNGQHIGVLFSSDWGEQRKGFHANFVSIKCK